MKIPTIGVSHKGTADNARSLLLKDGLSARMDSDAKSFGFTDLVLVLIQGRK
jgi:hypothetical protein